MKTKVIFLLFILFLLFMPTYQAKAQMPFGGRIVASIPCPFSGNFLVTIMPVTGPPQLIFRPGVSTLYKYGQIFRPGPNILGRTIGADVCILSILPPIAIPAPLMQMVGTSM